MKKHHKTHRRHRRHSLNKRKSRKTRPTRSWNPPKFVRSLNRGRIDAQVRSVKSVGKKYIEEVGSTVIQTGKNMTRKIRGLFT